MSLAVQMFRPGPPATASCGASAAAQFIALGRRGEPRWLVPAGHAPAKQDFLGWSPYRKSSQLAWKGMQAALRWGGTTALSLLGGERFAWNTDFDWAALGWCKDRPPVPLVYLGTPGERRKAVLHLLDERSGLCELIVKVPLTEGAAGAIAHEALVLRELESEGFAAAPCLVEFDSARGISSQTVVRGARHPMHLGREAAFLLHELELRDEQTSLRESAADLLVGGDVGGSEEEFVKWAFDELDDSTALPAVRIHGDFAPWNIKLAGEGAAALVDWEEARPSGLPLQDAFHFVHMTQCLFGRRPQPAHTRLRFRPRTTLTRGMYRKLEVAYLLRIFLQERRRHNRKYSQYLSAALRLVLEEQA